MDTSTSTGPMAVARLARARVMAPFRGLFEPVPVDGRSVLNALVEWLTDRIAEMGYAR